MRTTRTPAFLAYALGATLALAFAGCAGGGNQALVPSQVQPEVPAARAAMPRVRFTIVVRKSRRGKKHPQYISPSTKSATIVVGAASPVTVNLTPTSNGCTKTLPLTCTITLLVPAGNDTFAVTLYDALNGAGKQLSTGEATANVVKGAVTHVGVTLNGIVASLLLQLASSSPFKGSPSSIPLSVSALDADGNTIITPGDYENAISIADSDSLHTQLQLGSATPKSSVTVSAPGQSVTVVYDGSTSLSSATFTASVNGVASVTPVTAVLTPIAAQIVVNVAAGGTAISQDLLGANLPAWIDDTQSYIKTAMAGAGLHLVRWPGGSLADDYHWGDNGGHTPTTPCAGAYADLTDSTFDNFMTYSVPAGADVALTVNYGSNIACNGPGTATEAGDWAAYAHSKGYNVKYWTVGNENYGSWETDMHAAGHQHNPTQYGSEISAYASAIKTGYPGAKVGIMVDGQGVYDTWDSAVINLAKNKFDYVEYHYYAQQGSGNYPGGLESDSYLLGQGVTDFANSLTALRTELTTDGMSTSVPIYLGELNSIVSTAGKQTVSITNGLFAGMAMAEVMKQPGVTMATWWLAFGDCETAATGGNFDSSLYGFQNFGTYTLFSDQSSGCGTENTVPAGTAFPDGQAYGILSQFAGQTSVMQNVTTALSTTDVRAYADTVGSGYGVLLFNLNENSPVTYTVELANATQSSCTASQTTYGKAQYDLSQNNVWSGPVTNSLGTLARGFSVTLPPWSMNLVTLVPVGLDRKRAPRR
jgi:hypothetical protein